MRSAESPFWSRGWFWVLLAALSTLPFLVSPLPMLPDFFSHMGRYHVMNHGAESAFLPRYYSFQWTLIGNLGVDLLMIPLGILLPTEPAARIAAALIPVLTIAGIYAVARAANGRIEAPALLALPFVFSFSFMFGFVNYHFALGLALLAFALWIRSAPWPLVWRWAALLPLVFLIWLAHMVAWAVLLMLIGSWELASGWRGRSAASFVAATWRAMVRTLPLALPILLTIAWRSAADGGPAIFAYRLKSKLVWLAYALRAEVRWLDIGAMALLGIAGLWLLGSRQTTRDWRLLTGAGFLALLFAILPLSIFGAYYADARLVPPLAMIGFLGFAVPPGRGRTVIATIGLALFGARLATITWGWHQRGAAAVADLAVLDTVPRGSRIAVLATTSLCNGWPMNGYDHLASLMIIRREAFVNTEWDIPGALLMRPIYNLDYSYNSSDSVIIDGERPGCGQPVARRLAQIPQTRFDYVWIVNSPESASWLLPVGAGPHGRLYRIAPAQVKGQM